MFALFDLDDTLHDKTASLYASADAMYAEFLSNQTIKLDEFRFSFLSENCIIQPKAQVFEILVKRYRLEARLEPEMLHFFDSEFHCYSQRFEHILETMGFEQKDL